MISSADPDIFHVGVDASVQPGSNYQFAVGHVRVSSVFSVLSAFLPTHLPTYPPTYLPTLPTYLPTYLPTFLPSFVLSFFLSFLPSFLLCLCLSLCVSLSLSLPLSLFLYIYIYIYIYVCVCVCVFAYSSQLTTLSVFFFHHSSVKHKPNSRLVFFFRYPTKHFGTLLGIITVTVAIICLLQHPLFIMMESGFDGQPFWVGPESSFTAKQLGPTHSTVR